MKIISATSKHNKKDFVYSFKGPINDPQEITESNASAW